MFSGDRLGAIVVAVVLAVVGSCFACHWRQYPQRAAIALGLGIFGFHWMECGQPGHIFPGLLSWGLAFGLCFLGMWELKNILVSGILLGLGIAMSAFPLGATLGDNGLKIEGKSPSSNRRLRAKARPRTLLADGKSVIALQSGLHHSDPNFISPGFPTHIFDTGI